MAAMPARQQVAARLEATYVDIRQAEQDLEDVKVQLATASQSSRSALQQKELALLQYRTALAKRESVLLQLQLRQSAGDGYTGPKPFGYSELLAKTFNASPMQQYGMYATTAASIAYGAKQMWRYRLMMRAVHEPDAEIARELMVDARATSLDRDYAALYAKRYRMHGILAAVGTPLLYLGLLTAVNTSYYFT